jgi:hypothetical protein
MTKCLPVHCTVQCTQHCWLSVKIFVSTNKRKSLAKCSSPYNFPLKKCRCSCMLWGDAAFQVKRLWQLGAEGSALLKKTVLHYLAWHRIYLLREAVQCLGPLSDFVSHSMGAWAHNFSLRLPCQWGFNGDGEGIRSLLRWQARILICPSGSPLTIGRT